MEDPRRGVFESCLDHRRDIDEIQLFNLSEEVAYNATAGLDVIAQMRRLMQDCLEPFQRFVDFRTAGAEFNEDIRRQLERGAIAAVDGTDRLPSMAFTTTSLYAAGVAWVTSQSRGVPKIHLTSTTADLCLPLEQAQGLDMWALAQSMDQATQEGSWSTTFREYMERSCAKELPDAIETCLIDGPLFTQNLMTQKAGQKLMAELIKQPRRYIGVIKGLDSSWSLCRWAAQALEPGEVYILCTIQQAFTVRQQKGGSSDVMADWFGKHAPTYVRGVYRPGQKAFAFECAADDVEYAIALLREEASPQKGHEIPRLLQMVDAACRSSRNSSQAKERLLNQVRRHDRRMAEDLTDERDSR